MSLAELNLLPHPISIDSSLTTLLTLGEKERGEGWRKFVLSVFVCQLDTG